MSSRYRLLCASMSGLGLFASRMMGAQNWSPEARTLGSLPLGFLLLAPVTFLLMVAGYFAPAILNPAALLILAASCSWLIYERWRGELRIDGSMLAGGIFLLGLLLLRLAYLSYARRDAL